MFPRKKAEIQKMKKKIIRNEIKDYAFITLGLILYTFGWTFFLLPYEMVTGGVAGISAIVFYATSIPIEYTYFSLNCILLIIGLKFLGIKFLIKTIYAIILLSVFLHFAQDLIRQPDGSFMQILGPGQEFMSLVIGTMMIGCALAIVFLNNGSTGGNDIIAAIVNKYYNVSIGQVLIAVDILIICSCIPIFHNWRMVVFGLIAMAIEDFVLDYVMNARRESVQFLIFSGKYQEIANAIGTKTTHGVTLLHAEGWYTGNEMKVLCVMARKRESLTIFRLVKMIDPNAFISQSSVIGVYGKGFDTIKVKVKQEQASTKTLQDETDCSNQQ